jgi:hypothetical protein
LIGLRTTAGHSALDLSYVPGGTGRATRLPAGAAGVERRRSLPARDRRGVRPRLTVPAALLWGLFAWDRCRLLRGVATDDTGRSARSCGDRLDLRVHGLRGAMLGRCWAI